MKRLALSILTSIVALTSLGASASARPGDGYRGPGYRAPQGYRVAQPYARYAGAVEVQWGATWYAATVIAARNGQYLIHYDGWSSSWDEWVGEGRIRPIARAIPTPRFGYGDDIDPVASPPHDPGCDHGVAPVVVEQQVQIFWGNRWYPGRVLQTSGQAFLVHYDGYASSWDEWVGADRLRFSNDRYDLYDQASYGGYRGRGSHGTGDHQ